MLMHEKREVALKAETPWDKRIRSEWDEAAEGSRSFSLPGSCYMEGQWLGSPHVLCALVAQEQTTRTKARYDLSCLKLSPAAAFEIKSVKRRPAGTPHAKKLEGTNQEVCSRTRHSSQHSNAKTGKM